MGKTGAARATKKAIKSQQLTRFLTQDPKDRALEQHPGESPKMADAHADADDNTSLSRSEFHETMEELKATIQIAIADQIALAIKPLSDDLKSITSTLSEVAQAAEAALETATSTQEEVRQLQRTEDWTRSKILYLEDKMREKNLKFRNLPEKAEESGDLKTFLATWISKHLSLEDGVVPLIDKALALPIGKIKTNFHGTHDYFYNTAKQHCKTWTCNVFDFFKSFQQKSYEDSLYARPVYNRHLAAEAHQAEDSEGEEEPELGECIPEPAIPNTVPAPIPALVSAYDPDPSPTARTMAATGPILLGDSPTAPEVPVVLQWSCIA
ncbi:UNVERIFIED_CONTAM: hypothetical protein K2H54_052762 [Gekko kuhli]